MTTEIEKHIKNVGRISVERVSGYGVFLFWVVDEEVIFETDFSCADE